MPTFSSQAATGGIRLDSRNHDGFRILARRDSAGGALTFARLRPDALAAR
jgi:hypothetical protein